MSDFRYEIKTELKLRYLFSDMNTDFEKFGFGPYANEQRTTSSVRGSTNRFLRERLDRS
jgi:hypothetical protein